MVSHPDDVVTTSYESALEPEFPGDGLRAARET